MTPSPDAQRRLSLTSAAIRAIQQRLPESVAAALVEFIQGDLLRDPTRVGKPLRGDNELKGLWSARRGAYRVLYEIDEDNDIVRVVRIDHRRDVYRRL